MSLDNKKEVYEVLKLALPCVKYTHVEAEIKHDKSGELSDLKIMVGTERLIHRIEMLIGN